MSMLEHRSATDNLCEAGLEECLVVENRRKSMPFGRLAGNCVCFIGIAEVAVTSYVYTDHGRKSAYSLGSLRSMKNKQRYWCDIGFDLSSSVHTCGEFAPLAPNLTGAPGRKSPVLPHCLESCRVQSELHGEII